MSFLSRYEELGQSFNPDEVHMKQALRVNTLKTTADKLQKRLEKKGVLLEPIPFLPDAFYYESSFSLGATPEYLQGLYYLQEAASQLPPLVLNPKEHEKVLDMAAAPGSKTTQLAQLMNNTGVIVALDSDARRLKSLKSNLERCGVTNTISMKKDARFVWDLGLEFDKVLLDAPCSGNFCIEQDYFSTKTLTGIAGRAKLQKELLKSAYKVLKSKGTLVYSTCSLEPEEDELIIDWFVKKYPDMTLALVAVEVGDAGYTKVFGQELSAELSKTVRLWPHKTETQGFFIAKLVKS